MYLLLDINIVGFFAGAFGPSFVVVTVESVYPSASISACLPGMPSGCPPVCLSALGAVARPMSIQATTNCTAQTPAIRSILRRVTLRALASIVALLAVAFSFSTVPAFIALACCCAFGVLAENVQGVCCRISFTISTRRFALVLVLVHLVLCRNITAND